MVAHRHVGAHFVGLFVEGDENHIKVVAVIAQIDIGLLVGSNVVFGSPLNKALNPEHLACHRGVRLHPQKIRKPGRRAEAGDGDGGAGFVDIG